MHRRTVFAALVVVALVVLVPVAAQGANSHANYRAVCPGPPSGHARCHVLVVTDSQGKPKGNSSPGGLHPTDIKSAYGFSTSSTAGSGETIAIVDAYDDPTAESDLATFSGQFGLPACTTTNGCFTKVNQNGGSSLPRANSGWALEISLDIEWAHAVAPGAKILLVEASSNSFSNLLTAESYAGKHAGYVSNSWGGSEFSGENAYDSYFSHSGVSYFVSAGDNGLPAEYPSASPNVISVGGTTLTQNGGSWSETGWSSGGGGCSAYETATSAQSGFSQYGQVGCNGMRATPDVALDANPSSGVAVYDSTSYYGQSGWFVVGGTSASSPMWAARSADQGVQVNAAYVYGNNITFRDIAAGNNGAPCLVGFDLCSGRGSWTGSSGSSGVTPTLTSITLSPSSVGLSGGQQATFTATGKDQNGNPIDLSNVTWTTTAPGTLAPSGTSATFTASSTQTGSGQVKASSGGVSGSASVTVKASTSLSTMNVAVSTGSVSKKGRNYHVPVSVAVKDATSLAAVAGASVTLDVYAGTSCIGTPAASGTGTTGSNGQVGFTFSTHQSGSWCALANVTSSGYTAGSGSTTFTIP